MSDCGGNFLFWISKSFHFLYVLGAQVTKNNFVTINHLIS